jgi:DNA-binding response OmpR family regulator
MSGDGSSVRLAAHRVLIVDSDDSMRRMLGVALRCFGCETYQARDGPEVLQALRDFSLCAVIVDLPGPDPSNWPVLKVLGGSIEGRRPATIAISADDRALAVAAGLGVGATILKPFSLKQLQAVIESLVAEEGSPHLPTTPLRPSTSVRNRRLAGYMVREQPSHHALRR